MKKLLTTIEEALDKKSDLPFAVYTSFMEQKLLNVPIVKPLLIVVLSGIKKLGEQGELICHTGDFIFLSDRPGINMRNIPKDNSYFALLIEFDADDFKGVKAHNNSPKSYCIGKTTTQLEQCLTQFVEYSTWAPQKLWHLRKREIIELLCHLGHKEILSMLSTPKVGHQLHDLFSNDGFQDLDIEQVCHTLAMSESTLRRKLKAESTSFQEIKTQTRLGFGLHLLQTTSQSVSIIAERCGYLSQSRFTDRFKQRFGLTPTELRKTRITD
jgi:AraC-like DNA-binding protein